MFANPKRTRLRLKLILNLTNLLQKCVLNQSIQVCTPPSCFQQHSVVWMFRVVDLLINSTNLLRQAVFHSVTERTSMLTVHRKSGLPILAKYRQFKCILWANMCQFSYSVKVLKDTLMIIHAGRPKNFSKGSFIHVTKLTRSWTSELQIAY